MRRIAPIAAALLALAQAAHAQAGARVERSISEEAIRTLIWLAVAGALFVVAYKLVDLTTPGDLKQQLADGNTAMAVYVGALAIACAIIIAALVS